MCIEWKLKRQTNIPKLISKLMVCVTIVSRSMSNVSLKTFDENFCVHFMPRLSTLLDHIHSIHCGTEYLFKKKTITNSLMHHYQRPRSHFFSRKPIIHRYFVKWKKGYAHTQADVQMEVTGQKKLFFFSCYEDCWIEMATVYFAENLHMKQSDIHNLALCTRFLYILFISHWQKMEKKCRKQAIVWLNLLPMNEPLPFRYAVLYSISFWCSPSWRSRRFVPRVKLFSHWNQLSTRFYLLGRSWHPPAIYFMFIVIPFAWKVASKLSFHNRSGEQIQLLTCSLQQVPLYAQTMTHHHFHISLESLCVLVLRTL